MNPFQAIPTNVRKWLYLAFGVAGLIPTSVSTYAVAVGGTIPEWCIGVAAVLGVIGTGLGFTAAANVTDNDYPARHGGSEGGTYYVTNLTTDGSTSQRTPVSEDDARHDGR